MSDINIGLTLVIAILQYIWMTWLSVIAAKAPAKWKWLLSQLNRYLMCECCCHLVTHLAALFCDFGIFVPVLSCRCCLVTPRTGGWTRYGQSVFHPTSSGHDGCGQLCTNINNINEDMWRLEQQWLCLLSPLICTSPYLCSTSCKDRSCDFFLRNMISMKWTPTDCASSLEWMTVLQTSWCSSPCFIVFGYLWFIQRFQLCTGHLPSSPAVWSDAGIVWPYFLLPMTCQSECVYCGLKRDVCVLLLPVPQSCILCPCF